MDIFPLNTFSFLFNSNLDRLTGDKSTYFLSSSLEFHKNSRAAVTVSNATGAQGLLAIHIDTDPKAALVFKDFAFACLCFSIQVVYLICQLPKLKKDTFLSIDIFLNYPT